VDFNELRRDVKMAEERVERLRQEVKELQSKRNEPFHRIPQAPPPPPPPPPPPYVPPNMNPDYSNHNLAPPTNRAILDRSTSPLLQEVNF
jgi:hypothetical protein